ncbi:MAG: AI-2E family transporter [Myxococcales bacterium]|nr:AI-2E family transporter [Myxococcales bacterium]
MNPASPTRRVEISPKTMLTAVTVVAGCFLLRELLPVLLVIVVGLFLAGTLNPAVEWLERRRFGRPTAIAVVFVGLLTLAGLVAALTIPALVDQVRGVAVQEPELRRRLADLLARSRWTASYAQSLRDLHYDALARAWAGTAFAFSTKAISIVAYAVSAAFLGLYVMLDRDRLRGGLFAAVPRKYHIRLSRVLLNLETIVGGYIRGQALTSALMIAFLFALLSVCRVQSPLPIAVFAGIADVLPYVGVFLSVGPAALAAAPHGLVVTIVVVVAMLAYEEFESRLLVPRIYGHALRLPSSIVLVALLAGGTLLGFVGALLALPLAAAVRMLIEELRVALPGEVFDDPVLRARDERAEKEYATRAEGVPAERAAAIAVEIAEGRMHEEGGRERAVEVPITAGGDGPGRAGGAPRH